MNASRGKRRQQGRLALTRPEDLSGDDRDAIAFVPRTIVSGGQTGVDRAALEMAIELGLEHGGWCPLGRLAEDGPIPKRYRLQETGSSDYAVRTERNVVESDATLILYSAAMAGGTRLTRNLAREYRRPFLAADLAALPRRDEVARVQDWLKSCRPGVLNVAGPRESGCPGVFEKAREFLREVFARGADQPG